jgi:cyclase
VVLQRRWTAPANDDRHHLEPAHHTPELEQKSEAEMHRTLIVARMEPGRAPHVAQAFAESDSTDLPRLLGVTARSLFRFQDLYFHLIESERDIEPALGRLHDHPLFTGVTTRLAPHITAYDAGWREPRDAMAHEFYRWSR